MIPLISFWPPPNGCLAPHIWNSWLCPCAWTTRRCLGNTFWTLLPPTLGSPRRPSSSRGISSCYCFQWGRGGWWGCWSSALASTTRRRSWWWDISARCGAALAGSAALEPRSWRWGSELLGEVEGLVVSDDQIEESEELHWAVIPHWHPKMGMT